MLTISIKHGIGSPLDFKEIQQVHSEGDQPWDFFGRTDAKAETPVFWPPHVKSWLIGKVPDPGRDLGVAGDGDNRGWDDWMASPTGWTWVLVNSGSWWWTGRPGLLWLWGHEESDTTEWLNWTEHIFLFFLFFTVCKFFIIFFSFFKILLYFTLQ